MPEVTRAAPEVTPRYAVSMRMTGLGDRMICLGAAWRFARNTGRTLVADWRFSPYLTDLGANLFPTCFQAPPELAGVPFIGDDRVGRVTLPGPRHPSPWNDDILMQAPFMRRPETLLADRDAAVALMRSGGDVPQPTVVFDACVNDGLVLTADSRTFLAALQPVAGVTAKAAAFRQKHLAGGPWIGLHIRHGNGAVTGHDRYWHSFSAAVARCADAVARTRRQLGANTRVLLCTDNVQVERAMSKAIRGVVCRSKFFRRPGEGELHLFHGAHRTLEDALVEMLLLADADALIRYPPGSFFSFYGAVMRRWQSPLPETVYDLQCPSDPADPLSPAVLL